MPLELKLGYPHSPLRGIIFIVAAALVGCSNELAVREYTVAKKKDASSVGAIAPVVEQRMLGVIVPQGESAWYFKMMDVPDKIAEHEADFRSMVANVRFEPSGEPQFQLLDGWSKEEVRSIVFARLVCDQDKVTATVTQLPAPTEDEAAWRNSVFDNVNRWRNQLSLSPVDWESMQPDLEEVPELTQGLAKAYFVSLVGKKSTGGGMGNAPFMNSLTEGGNGSPAQPQQRPEANRPAANDSATGLSYSVPDGWEEQTATGIRKASFAIEDGEKPASVIVSTASVKSEMLVDMWMEQLGIEASDEAKQQVTQGAQIESINGIESTLYLLEGPAGESILVAQIPWNENESLFAKMTGSTACITSQREAFMNFLKSMKW